MRAVAEAGITVLSLSLSLSCKPESVLERERERERPPPTYAAMYTNTTLPWTITREGKINER